MDIKDLGRVPEAPGSREPSPAVSALTGFDPLRDELDQLIATMDELLQAATPGEWIWYQNGWAPHWTGEKLEFVSTPGMFNGVGSGDMDGGDWAVAAFQGDGVNGANNARFITCAKNWMPILLECARAVREMERHVDASAIEAAAAGETADAGSTVGESAARQGDAQSTPGTPHE
jgi:hypothetical protein